jgi:hypothetical protein
MKAALLTLAMIGSQLTIPVSERVPDINVQKLCKLIAANAKIMGEPKPQSVSDCVREENDAKQELVRIWPKTDSVMRDRCEGEATALGTRTYLDLLTCLQIANDTRSAGKGRAKSK